MKCGNLNQLLMNEKGIYWEKGVGLVRGKKSSKFRIEWNVRAAENVSLNFQYFNIQIFFTSTCISDLTTVCVT